MFCFFSPWSETQESVPIGLPVLNQKKAGTSNYHYFPSSTGKTGVLARHARRDTPTARPARGVVLPDPRGDIVADRARRSGTSGSPGGRFPARESSVSFFRLGVFPPPGLINHGFASQRQIPSAGKREPPPQSPRGSYRTPGKGHRARGELTRPRRASTSSPRARCEARARAFRVFPVAIFRKSAHLPVLKTVSYTISRRKVISERRKVVIIRDTSLKDVVTFSTTFHPGFFDDLALLFVL